MKKPEYTKPFDMEHAKAGAPYGCRNGSEATVMKWNGRNDNYPLIGIVGSEDAAASWTTDGFPVRGAISAGHCLVMLPLGFIDGKPVWTCDEIVSPAGSQMAAWPSFRDFANCTWPAPAPVYPETLLTNDYITKFCQKHDAEVRFDRDYISGFHGSIPGPVKMTVYMRDGDPFSAIANAALRHAIDAGQVVLPGAQDKLLTIIGAAYQVAGAHGASEAVLDVLCDPMAATAAQIDAMLPYEAPNDAARDLAIADAAAKAVYNKVYQFGFQRTAYCDLGLDLPAIIAGVAK